MTFFPPSTSYSFVPPMPESHDFFTFFVILVVVEPSPQCERGSWNYVVLFFVWGGGVGFVGLHSVVLLGWCGLVFVGGCGVYFGGG